MRRTPILFFGFLFILVMGYHALAAPAIEDIDRIRIAEAFRIGEKLQRSIWPTWNEAPFSLLFLTDDYEFLIRHPKPSDEFQSIGFDKLLKSEVFWRPRKFKKDFLATFPAFTRTPVIVAGKAENTTEKTSTRWVFVLLHEHFHQLQYSRPNYFDDVNALNLSGGDTSGMWQLNFPFPYKNKEVADKYKQLSEKLLALYNARDRKGSKAELLEYIDLRRSFAKMLSPDDYRYLSFQLWQEGTARYTQYKASELAARRLKPGKAFRGLKDYTSFKAESGRLLRSTLEELKTLDMTTWERTVFYPLGAVEGLVLDKVNPKWRSKYFTDKFALEKFYPTGKK